MKIEKNIVRIAFWISVTAVMFVVFAVAAFGQSLKTPDDVCIAASTKIEKLKAADTNLLILATKAVDSKNLDRGLLIKLYSDDSDVETALDAVLHSTCAAKTSADAIRIYGAGIIKASRINDVFMTDANHIMAEYIRKGGK